MEMVMQPEWAPVAGIAGESLIPLVIEVSDTFIDEEEENDE